MKNPSKLMLIIASLVSLTYFAKGNPSAVKKVKVPSEALPKRILMKNPLNDHKVVHHFEKVENEYPQQEIEYVGPQSEAILEGQSEELDFSLRELQVSAEEVHLELQKLTEKKRDLKIDEDVQDEVRRTILERKRWEVIAQFNGYDVKASLEEQQGL